MKNLDRYIDYVSWIDDYTRNWLRKYEESSRIKKILECFDKPETKDYSWVVNLRNTSDDRDPNNPWIHRWEKSHGVSMDNKHCSVKGCNNILDPDSKENNGGHVFVLSKGSEHYARICIVPICHDCNSKKEAFQVTDALLEDKKVLEQQ